MNNYNKLIDAILTEEIEYSTEAGFKTTKDAPIFNIYGAGKQFRIRDNSILFEIVKMVKDVLDKHFYRDQIIYDIDIKYDVLEMKFVMSRGEYKAEAFVEGIADWIRNKMFKKYDDKSFIIKQKIGKLDHSTGPKTVVTVEIRESQEDDD